MAGWVHGIGKRNRWIERLDVHAGNLVGDHPGVGFSELTIQCDHGQRGIQSIVQGTSNCGLSWCLG